MTTLTPAHAAAAYDLLVSIGGAPESMRDSFLYHHTSPEGCGEWRFQGLLGYGGKFYATENCVDCYSEHLTPDRQALITRLNQALAALPA